MISNELIKLQPKSIFTVRSNSETLHIHSDSQVVTGLLNDFDPISLDEMDGVKMMRRFDSKYVMNIEILNRLLKAVQGDYCVLEVSGKRIQSYHTVYYDTPDNRFYLSHHNGLGNRIKLRKREYTDSGLVFLEIKLRNNKGEIRKKRMLVRDLDEGLSDEQRTFIQKHSTLNGDKLEAKFISRFKRITLVSKKLDERCTIDMDLHFHSFSGEKSDLKNLIVAELKQRDQKMKSKLARVLKENRVYKQSFSKYCIGRAMNENDLKSNLFKPELQQIKNKFQ